MVDYMELWRLSMRRSRSEADYRQFQTFQASLLVDYLKRHDVAVKEKCVLDLGSGVGGYSREFARQGAKVISVDLVQPKDAALSAVTQLQASALMIPLLSESVDTVFCASLIEHVARPQDVLMEAERVLKPGGFGYFSFPPYYSPLGGHEYAPFHYLGETMAFRLVRHQAVLPNWVSQMHGASKAPRSFSELYKGWGLYRMTIRKFQQLVKKTGFTYMDLSTRYMPVSFVRWPILGEVLTWHAQFLLQKPLYVE